MTYLQSIPVLPYTCGSINRKNRYIYKKTTANSIQLWMGFVYYKFIYVTKFFIICNSM